MSDDTRRTPRCTLRVAAYRDVIPHLVGLTAARAGIQRAPAEQPASACPAPPPSESDTVERLGQLELHQRRAPKTAIHDLKVLPVCPDNPTGAEDDQRYHVGLVLG